MPTCRGCGAQGIFDSWHLSLWEAVGKYCYTYELQPWGPHRGLADKLLTAMRDTCVHCGGACILTIDEETWQDCLACESTGGVWYRPFAEVDAVWSLITKRLPHAAMPWVGRRPQQPREEQREQPALAAPAPAVPDVAVAVCTPGTQTARRVRARRSTGVSPDGTSYDALRRVFAQAQRALGTEWQLFGRGHCDRNR